MSAYDNVTALPSDFWGSPVLRDAKGLLYCPGYTGDPESSRPWETVLFNSSLKTPGICEVSVKKAQDADIKKSAGTDMARITTHGVKPAEVDILITIWTPEQYKRLRDLWDFVMPNPGKNTAKAVDVYHPTLRLHGIKSVVVLRGEGPAMGPVPKSRVFTIHGLQFEPQPKNNATKTQKKSEADSLYEPGADQSKINDAKTLALPGAAGTNTGPNS